MVYQKDKTYLSEGRTENKRQLTCVNECQREGANLNENVKIMGEEVDIRITLVINDNS